MNKNKKTHGAETAEQKLVGLWPEMLVLRVSAVCMKGRLV